MCAPYFEVLYTVHQPQMLCGVCAPRPPRFRSSQQARGRERGPIDSFRTAKQSDIRSRKRIRLSKRSECDVLGGPLSDPVNFTEPCDRLFDCPECPEKIRICCSRLG